MARIPLSRRRNVPANLTAGLRRVAPGSASGTFAGASPIRPRPKAEILQAPVPSGGAGGLACYASFDCTNSALPGSLPGTSNLSWTDRNSYGSGAPTVSGTTITVHTSGFYLLSLVLDLDDAGGDDVCLRLVTTNSFSSGFGSASGNHGNWGDGPDDSRALGVFLRSGCTVQLEDHSSAHGIEQIIFGLACLSEIDDSFFGFSYTQI